MGWLALFIAAFLPVSNRLHQHLLRIGGRVISIILLSAFVVGWLLTRGMPGDIFSFEGVLLTNTVPEKVLSAWFEVLGLALLVARWMLDDTIANQRPKPILAIGLVCTFFAAALGLLVYLMLVVLLEVVRKLSPVNH